MAKCPGCDRHYPEGGFVTKNAFYWCPECHAIFDNKHNIQLQEDFDLVDARYGFLKASRKKSKSVSKPIGDKPTVMTRAAAYEKACTEALQVLASGPKERYDDQYEFSVTAKGDLSITEFESKQIVIPVEHVKNLMQFITYNFL